MSAARHVHPDQLRMFIPAGELADPEKFEHHDVKFGVDETYESVKKRKLDEAATGNAGNSRFRWGQRPDSWWSESAAARASTMPTRGGTLRESIVAEGIKEPVNVFPALPASGHEYLRKPMLGNGHHRVFVANDLDPKTEVPVIWKD